MWGPGWQFILDGGYVAGNGSVRAAFFRLCVQEHLMGRAFKMQVPGLFPLTLHRNV